MIPYILVAINKYFRFVFNSLLLLVVGPDVSCIDTTERRNNREVRSHLYEDEVLTGLSCGVAATSTSRLRIPGVF